MPLSGVQFSTPYSGGGGGGGDNMPDGGRYYTNAGGGGGGGPPYGAHGAPTYQQQQTSSPYPPRGGGPGPYRRDDGEGAPVNLRSAAAKGCYFVSSMFSTLGEGISSTYHHMTTNESSDQRAQVKVACTLSAQLKLCGKMSDLLETIAGTKRDNVDITLLIIDNRSERQPISASLAYDLARDMNDIHRVERIECDTDEDVAFAAAFRLAGWSAMSRQYDRVAFVHAGLPITPLLKRMCGANVQFVDVRGMSHSHVLPSMLDLEQTPKRVTSSSAAKASMSYEPAEWQPPTRQAEPPTPAPVVVPKPAPPPQPSKSETEALEKAAALEKRLAQAESRAEQAQQEAERARMARQKWLAQAESRAEQAEQEAARARTELSAALSKPPPPTPKAPAPKPAAAAPPPEPATPPPGPSSSSVPASPVSVLPPVSDVIGKMEGIAEHLLDEMTADSILYNKNGSLQYIPNGDMLEMAHGFDKFKDSTFEDLSAGQQPHTLIFACSDSRCDPTVLLQEPLGKLFVVRSVANIIPPFGEDSVASSALEYGVLHLKVRHVVVCGHRKCGGIKAALAYVNSEKDPDADRLTEVHNWVSHLSAPVAATRKVLRNAEAAGDEQCKLCEVLGVRTSLANLRTYPFVQEKLASGDIQIHGWMYDIQKGGLTKVHEPDMSTGHAQCSIM